MNSMQVKDKARNIAQNKNIDFNTVLRVFMYDRFIERLAASTYKDNFILKGGFYLSCLFGVENRTTMDIDAAVKNVNFTEENIRKIIIEILNIDIGDNAILTLNEIEKIRKEDKYGGYRAIITVKFENIREKFSVDIATGDPITPGAVVFEYFPLFEKKSLKLFAYNIETVLAEKLETILSRIETSSRIRDYYDIYLIYKLNYERINFDHFVKAVVKTFKKRCFDGDVLEIFNTIKNSDVLRIRWGFYQKKNNYAEDITYDEIMVCLESLIDIAFVSN